MRCYKCKSEENCETRLKGIIIDCDIFISKDIYKQIEFKGKSIDYNEWIYGYFQQYPDGRCFITNDCDKFMTIEDMYADQLFGSEMIEVIPETVGQYSTLTDKDNEKIYTGDIVVFGGHHLEIKFEKGAFGFYLNGFTPLATLFCCKKNKLMDIKKIGNIHDK